MCCLEFSSNAFQAEGTSLSFRCSSWSFRYFSRCSWLLFSRRFTWSRSFPMALAWRMASHCKPRVWRGALIAKRSRWWSQDKPSICSLPSCAFSKPKKWAFYLEIFDDIWIMNLFWCFGSACGDGQNWQLSTFKLWRLQWPMDDPQFITGQASSLEIEQIKATMAVQFKIQHIPNRLMRRNIAELRLILSASNCVSNRSVDLSRRSCSCCFISWR